MPTFDETLDQVRELLQSRGRLSYRALKRRFELDNEYLEDLKDELIKAERVAVDEDGAVLVWIGGDAAPTPPTQQSASLSQSVPPDDPSLPPQTSPQADRRQLTVMFCDLVGSTPMSAQLDPEDYRDIMQAYQEMCGQVLARFTGHIARYEGDGILVYFGYPQAREDAAAQAVRASLHILAGLPDLNASFQPRFPLLQERPLQVRIGLHTGLVVVGEMGSEQYRIDIAVGETPNMAARIQGQAGPNEVIISTATYKLVEGLFVCEELEPRELKGIAALQSVYRVMGEGKARSRFEVALQKGLTPLAGRTEELRVLHQRWGRVQAGEGQVVLLSGEPGIGKSRLLQELRERSADDSLVSVACRCSPSTQNSALAPIIEHLQRLLRFDRNESPDAKVRKLEHSLSTYEFPLPDSVPLLASLLSLPVLDTYAPLQFSPQKQKEKTLELLVTWLCKDAERQPVRIEFEDVHWADPSSLDFLTLLIDQIPTMQSLLVLTFRPEFIPPWPARAHILPLHLERLPQAEIARLAEYVAGGILPAEVVQQVVAKTDGVPLFAEELTKTVLESGQLQETDGHYELVNSLHQVIIPATLQDSLRARLDRLDSARDVAQLGAVIGREFSYELLHAVSSTEETILRHQLQQLVAADLIFQKGLPPRVQYLFKHALVQDAAYQSLLRSTRKHYHQKIAQVLEENFPDTPTAHPELIAHHYTEAGLGEQAIPYWQRAGQIANQRSANIEAINYFTQGIAVLQSLPDTPERAQQELPFQVGLGGPLIAIKGWAAPEVGAVYTRARELCRQVGETPQIFPVLWGLCAFHSVRADWQTARELAEQLFSIAQSVHDHALLLEAHYAMGQALSITGEFARGREHLEQLVSLYDPEQHHALAFVHGLDPGVLGRAMLAYSLLFLGYLDQARKRSQDALSLAQELSHSNSSAFALSTAAWLQQCLRDNQAAQERVETAIALTTEQGYPFYLTEGAILQGYLRAAQGHREVGITQMRTALDANQATGAELSRPRFLTVLAEVYGQDGSHETGLTLLAEASTLMEKTGERSYAAETYRLKGELLLNNERSMRNDERRAGEATALPQVAEAEECFQTAIDIAQRQQAKLWELRAATSLARLWQQQGKTTEARDLLTPIYDWFTEGFDTKDLQEAKALLNQLSWRV